MHEAYVMTRTTYQMQRIIIENIIDLRLTNKMYCEVQLELLKSALRYSTIRSGFN